MLHSPDHKNIVVVECRQYCDIIIVYKYRIYVLFFLEYSYTIVYIIFRNHIRAVAKVHCRGEPSFWLYGDICYIPFIIYSYKVIVIVRAEHVS